MNQFKETYSLFHSALTDLEFNTYWTWMLIPDNLKAVALYVRFYDEIALAWRKTVKPFMEEETAVSTLMQYILKNVEIIKADRKRYTPSYMYKIAFNAFYPLGRIQRDIDRFNQEETFWNYTHEFDNQSSDDVDNNFYWDSPYLCKVVAIDESDDERLEEVWKIIESCDEQTKKVIESLIGGKKLGKRLKAKSPEIIAELKIKLCNYF